MSYDHLELEKKWQTYWSDHQTFAVLADAAKPKFYILDMFPYPSGAGLHVGHTLGYTASDIIARYKRMQGFTVLHPMGWDSFGLPAEQYAVRTGQHPARTTTENVRRYKQQLTAMGFSYDWSRELSTSDPQYYRWTQWMFTLFYERGLAYQAEVLVNYCPALSAILSNEEVEGGKSKEGGYAIERRPLSQWLLKITAYAERLLADLETLDWPESLKRQQRHWIGKSEGVEVAFWQPDSQMVVKVFTTRPDTLLGVTFLALAPEHPLLAQSPPAHRDAVRAYQKLAASRSDLQRAELDPGKSGVYSGLVAEHPISKRPIPIWVADYVLPSYGTGAVMGVPAHDERDFAFARQFSLPILRVLLPVADPSSNIERSVETNGEQNLRQLSCFADEGVLCNSNCPALPELDGLSSQVGGAQITSWLERAGCGARKVTYRLRDWLFSRQRYWGEPIPILHFSDGTRRCLELDELPLIPPQVENFKPDANGQSPLARATEWLRFVDKPSGRVAEREINTMPQWAGSCWYYLRFCDPHNDQAFADSAAEHYWLPVDVYVGGAEHAVLHLLYARFWHKVLFDCRLVSSSEPFSQLKNPGMLTATSFKLPSGSYVDPARVKRCGDNSVLAETGQELVVQEEKMSKSKLNGVNPDKLLERFGADALRLYLMFMGPFEREKVWNTEAVRGTRRFLQRIHTLVLSEKVGKKGQAEVELRALYLSNRLIEAVQGDFENWQFNTAIAKMMEFLNEFSQLPIYPEGCVETLVLLLAPMAPHLAEELWEHLGHTESLASFPFPEVDKALLKSAKVETITFVIQVNGKLRARLDMDRASSRKVLLAAALELPAVAKFIDGQPIARVVFLPEKLLNIVVTS